MPQPGRGEVLLRHIYLSLDPYQRPAMAGRHATGDGPLGAGDMPPAETISQVLASDSPAFAVGDQVRHFGGWQTHSVAPASALQALPSRELPRSYYLGVLGMPGLTAWASIIRLADVQAGQTVLVSAAAGPVGSTLGQIAMKLGAQVVGIAGSDEKCDFVVNQLGFNGCVNYKKPDYPASLGSAVPDGVDIYHDNVGGPMLVEAMGVLRHYGIVVLCGLMSAYNDPSTVDGLYLGLPIIKRAVMKGLVVYDFEDQRNEFLALLTPWVVDGSLQVREDRAIGIDKAGAHFCRLMRGENFGKALVVLGAESE